MPTYGKALNANCRAKIEDCQKLGFDVGERGKKDFRLPTSELEVNMTYNNEHMAQNSVSRHCGSDPDRRILHKITPLKDWPVLAEPPKRVMTIAVVDCETTGFDPEEDAIIQLAMAQISVEAEGRVCKILRKGQGLNDPGLPIPPKITALTGITDADVASKAFGSDAFAKLLLTSDAVLAHNAAFDRPFIERLIPGITKLPWICSMANVDWLAHGFDGAKLGYLLNQMGLFAPKAHSALADVEALVNLLNCNLPSGRTVISEAIASAKVPTVKIEAVNAANGQLGALRRRGYRWNPRRKNWWTEISKQGCAAELAWLHEHNKQVDPRVTDVNWHTRYQR